MVNFSTALIAGGRSSRMGRDKCLLPVDDGPLWRRQISLLEKLNPAERWISCREEQEYFRSASARGVRLIHDEVSNAGPLGGLAAVLRQATTNLVLVLGVDLPLMDLIPLEFLLQQSTPDCGAVFLNDANHEPLAAVYPASLASLASSQIEKGQLRLQQFIQLALIEKKLVSHQLPEAWKAKFRNANTPADLD